MSAFSRRAILEIVDAYELAYTTHTEVTNLLFEHGHRVEPSWLTNAVDSELLKDYLDYVWRTDTSLPRPSREPMPEISSSETAGQPSEGEPCQLGREYEERRAGLAAIQTFLRENPTISVPHRVLRVGLDARRYRYLWGLLDSARSFSAETSRDVIDHLRLWGPDILLVDLDGGPFRLLEDSPVEALQSMTDRPPQLVIHCGGSDGLGWVRAAFPTAAHLPLAELERTEREQGRDAARGLLGGGIRPEPLARGLE